MTTYFRKTRQGLKSPLQLLIFVLLAGLLQACLKKEYMPPSVGEPVPYNDSTDQPISQALRESPYTLFSAIWKRSAMEATLTSLGDSRLKVTVLAPDNATLERLGWTPDKVEHTEVETLHTFLASYVFKGQITLDALSSKSSGYPAESFLEIPEVRSSSDGDPYFLTGYLFYADGELSVNGKSFGESIPINAKEGTIWPLGAALEIPVSSAWELLQADERFSLYVDLMNYTDAQYNELLTEANNGQAPQGEEARNSPVFYDLDMKRTGAGLPYVEQFNTWFIPTNEAFHKAGFQSLEDLIAFNQERGLPQAVWSEETSRYQLKGEFATDTLLDYHDNWGMRVASYSLTRRRNATLFYSTDLKQEILADYPITAFTEIEYGYYFPMYGETTFHYMPFEFNGDNQLWVKGLSSRKVDIVEKDINTLNGVVHAVDQLLLPAGFLTQD